MNDLFADQAAKKQSIDVGVTLLKGYADTDLFTTLIHNILSVSPLRHMGTTMGHNMRVTTSNCGEFGGNSDINGYRYLAKDPLTHQSWPDMPDAFYKLAVSAAEQAGILNFSPDSCLINHYPIGVQMGSHQDKEELDFSWPIVSVSIGLSAIFQIFGQTRSGVEREIQLDHGDVLILSGPARLYYHGVKAIKPDKLQPNLTERFNLTFRTAR